MLRNYLKLAWRNMQRHRGFALINIFGLALGMGSFLLICLHLTDEWSYDRFHEDHHQLYRVYEEVLDGADAGDRIAPVGLQVPMQITHVLPEVTAKSLVFTFGRRTVRHEEVFAHEPFTVTNPEFFSVFSFPLLQGNPETALTEPYTVVISSDAALRYFGKTDVMGEVLDLNGWEAEITGVMADFPKNSHLQFDFLFSLKTIEVLYPQIVERLANDFSSNNFTTYVRLADQAESQEVAQKLTNWVMENRTDSSDVQSAFHLQPIADVHLYSDGIQEEYNMRKGDPQYLWAFVGVAFFILLIACINYTNLATALATRRAREVGMRKVLGSRKPQLIGQFLSESFLLTLIALVIGFSLVQLALPYYNRWSGKEMYIQLLDWKIFILLITIVLGVALLAGSYPAFFLSRFSPTIVLKGIERRVNRKMGLREVLVMVQFGLSAMLVMSTGIMFQQLNYLQTKSLGFEKDHQLVIDINSGIARRQFETFKADFSRHTAVQSVSVSSRVPGEWKNFPMAQMQHPLQPEEQVEAIYLAADWDFLDTYRMELVSGRNFTTSMADSATVILNETAASKLGIAEANGQEIVIPFVRFGSDTRAANEPMRARVIGIVKDFHFEDLHQTLKPALITYHSNPFHAIDYYTLRVQSDDPQQLIDDLEATYAAIDPDNAMEWHFLDAQWAAKYVDDTRNGQLIGWFAGLGLLIACLGLFALASLTIQRRLKEVAIRKVLGSSRSQLVRLLSFEFLRLVSVSLLVGIPLAILLTRSWLASFAYRTTISFTMLGVLTVSILGLAFLTVSTRTYQAAGQNPVKALRSE